MLININSVSRSSEAYCIILPWLILFLILASSRWDEQFYGYSLDRKTCFSEHLPKSLLAVNYKKKQRCRRLHTYWVSAKLEPIKNDIKKEIEADEMSDLSSSH